MTIAAIHPFERAGLGKAPFRCTGFYESKYQAVPGDPNCPIQPGSMCDYCSAGIMNVFVIKSSDGKEFKVGCDCVAKTYDACAKTELEKEARRLRDEVNRKKTAHLNARKDKQIAAALEKLAAHRGTLAECIIPPRHFGGVERNALEYFDWMFKNSGRTGKLKAAKQLEKLLGGAS